MVVEAKSYLTAPMKWSLGDDPEYPYEAEHEGHKLLVRLNDFPEEELYALIADGEEIVNFDEWPDSWTRPSVSENSLDRFVASESIKETRKLTEEVFRSPQAPDASSPDENLLEKETAALCEKVRADVYLEVKRELENSSPTEIRVVTSWGAGMNLPQISAVTGIRVSTVQRHLTAWQKRVINRMGHHQIGNKDPEHRVADYEMIQSAVKKFTHAA